MPPLIRLLTAALALLPTAAAAAPSDTMTLAQARRLSPQQLAARLLGDAGDYREADVQGNGGGMIAQPGLNAVTLYQRPIPAGFAGLCRVDGVTIRFIPSRHDARGDPPHRVAGRDRLVRFAAAGEATDRTCAALTPVVARADPLAAPAGPVLLAVTSDRAADAAFALRAVDRALAARTLPGCTARDADPSCADRAATLHTLARDRFHYAKVERCSDTPAWCVSATWFRSRRGNETDQVDLLIHTDAQAVDAAAFAVTAVLLDASTTVDD